MTAVRWTSRISEIAAKQIPFARAETLNQLARGAAEDAREAAQIDLNIKRPAMLRAFIRAPATHKATKLRFSARVVVAAPQSANPDRGNILTQHEAAGTKRPFRGRSIAMPSRDIVKPGRKRAITRGTELRTFQPFTTKAGGQVVGQKGSFMITLKRGTLAGRKMLLQRFGRGKKQVRGLWLFVPSTRLTPKLRFNATVKQHVQQHVAAAFKRAFSKALASAKPLRGATQSTRL